MNLIRWTDSLSLKNLQIDHQHKELIRLTNNLILNSNAHVHSEIIGETLHELLMYSKRHFKSEEEFLEKINYPKLAEHRANHEEFVYEIAMFCEDVMNGKSTVTKEMIQYLVKWIVNHTSKDDLDYKNYI